MGRPLQKPWTKKAARLWEDFYSGAADKPRDAELGRNMEERAARIRRPSDGKPVTHTKAAGPSEHQVQCAVIQWWARAHKQYRLPEFALFAIPNGGARDVITGARLKAEGVRRGVVDLMLAASKGERSGLFMEMKIGKNNPSPEQLAFIEHLRSQNYTASVHWESESAIQAIKDYLGEPFDTEPTPI